MLVFFMAISYIWKTFSMFCSDLVFLKAIWYILDFSRKKSGNPGAEFFDISFRRKFSRMKLIRGKRHLCSQSCSFAGKKWTSAAG
jgi:hypothetical protein